MAHRIDEIEGIAVSCVDVTVPMVRLSLTRALTGW